MINKFNRFIINNIKNWLNRPEIIVIIGSRQVGKTFLVKNILSELTSKQINYFNFEDFSLREKFKNNPNEFIANISDAERIYVFDEFQKVPEFTSSLKVLYDEKKNEMPKIFLTGSSSLEIQNSVSQSLVGQCLVFDLYSLSFAEKYFGKNDNFISAILEGSFDVAKFQRELFFKDEELKNNLNEYLLEGGYPELSEIKKELRAEKIKSIIETILDKDLQNMVRAEHLFSAKKILEILSFRIGNIISFDNLAAETQLNVKTVRDLIAKLEGLYFIKLIYPFSKFAHEYKKAPKVYFCDSGIRNELIKMRQLPIDNSQLGGLIENYIYGQLLRSFEYDEDYKIHYWQDYNKNEVDFILSRGEEIFSIEVKFRRSQKQKINLGVINFIEKYKPRIHITVTYDYFGKEKIGDCRVYFLPAYVFGFLI